MLSGSSGRGEPGEVLYVIAAGNAKVHVERGGLSSTVTMLGSEQFGEMSLLTGEPPFAMAVSTTELSLIAVGKAGLMWVVQDDQPLLERIGEAVARR